MMRGAAAIRRALGPVAPDVDLEHRRRARASAINPWLIVDHYNRVPVTQVQQSRPDALVESEGVQGNRRLTSLTAIVLLVLLFVEGLTVLLGVGGQIRLHVFVGMLLIPPIALKLLSVGYRFVRYYTESITYRAAGPPHWLMRSLGPLVVASTIALFGSGVVLIAYGRNDLAIAVHRLSFFAWLALMSIHVLWHWRELPHAVLEEWSRRRATAGPLLRAGTITAALAAGVVIALLTVHLAGGFSHHRFDRGFGDGH